MAPYDGQYERIFPGLAYSEGMSVSPSDDVIPSLPDELAREQYRLVSSGNAFAVINPDGLLSWKDVSLHEVRKTADPVHGAAAMVTVVDPRGGAEGIRGFRPEVAGHLPAEYAVNPVGRHVRAALAAGAGQTVPNEELRGNLVLCGVAHSGGAEVGLTPWQLQLIRVAHRAAHDAARPWSSFLIVGRSGQAGSSTVYLPGLHRDGMSSDEARQSAERLLKVADSADDMNSPALRPR